MERRTDREVVRPAVSVRRFEVQGARVAHDVSVRVCGLVALSGSGSRLRSLMTASRMQGALLFGGVEGFVGCAVLAWLCVAWLMSISGVSEKRFGPMITDTGTAIAQCEAISTRHQVGLLPRSLGPPRYRT